MENKEAIDINMNVNMDIQQDIPKKMGIFRKKIKNDVINGENSTEEKKEEKLKRLEKADNLINALIKRITRGICGILIIMIIANAVLVGISLVNEKCRLEPSSVIELVLLEAGFAIIGLAVAVWAALNIVNTLERKEFNELDSKIDDLSKKSGTFDDILEKSNAMYKEAFLQELLKKEEARNSSYFVDGFGKTNYKDIYLNLLQIEQLAYVVYEKHQSAYWDDLELEKKAKEGLHLIDNMNSMISTGGIPKDKVLCIYLNYRKAEFNFFMGYCAIGNDKFRKFEKAAECYLDSAYSFYEKFPKYDEAKLWGSKREFCPESGRTPIYLANCIGESYSKSIEGFKGLRGTISDEKLLEYAKKAIFYCTCATDWVLEDKKYIREVYFRNCGCAYERYDRIVDRYNLDNARGEEEKKKVPILTHSDDVMNMYKKAFYIAINDNKLSNDRVDSIYHTILSYSERYMRKEIFGNYAVEASEVVKDDKQLAIALENIKKKANREGIGKLVKILGEYRLISEMAITERTRRTIMYALNGSANTYMVMFILSKNEFALEVFGEETEPYMQTIGKNLQVLKQMLENVNRDDYTMELQRRENVIKQYLVENEENKNE